MAVLVFLAVGVAWALLVFVVVRIWWRRSAGGTEYRELWHGVDRRRRRRIGRSVRRGEAVRDPRDAALAVRFAEYVLARKTSAGYRRFQRVELLLLPLALSALVVDSLHRGAAAWLFGLIPIASFFFLLLLRRRLQSRSRVALHANRSLLETTGSS